MKKADELWEILEKNGVCVNGDYEKFSNSYDFNAMMEAYVEDIILHLSGVKNQSIWIQEEE